MSVITTKEEMFIELKKHTSTEERNTWYLKHKPEVDAIWQQIREEGEQRQKEHQRRMDIIIDEHRAKMRWFPLGLIVHKIRKRGRPEAVDVYLAEWKRKEKETKG